MALWRSGLLPILGLLLVFQYASWTGLPLLLHPFNPEQQQLGGWPGHEQQEQQEWFGLPQPLPAWLGLEGVTPLLMWTLFGAATGCLSQVRTALATAPFAASLWVRCSDANC